ncbi:ABC transporter ATP-binding protein [Fundidesulfovibrio terrae]|uniref:ABC transporter ATP-binding protein n=1 Tax=Fundidesulfovibrio terrae TaxID=2922866 RepID=UPI001FAE9E83|nr:ABC transporter ATP-binding protein [Fundidesulfovibrio terrae]
MLTLSGITKRFHKGSINEVLALDGVDLDIRKGDFITVIGSNGAGKSTTLNCIAGCFMPDKGSITLNSETITTWPEYKRARFIGRVFQDPLMGSAASLSIEENMALADRRGKVRGLSAGVKAKDRERYRELLSRIGLGLENRLKDKVGLLSGGQRQSLTMIMATMVRPEILLLDEHTAALDPKTAGHVLELTDKLVESEKLTTLMVTHNMNHALKLGNRLIMMHQGRVILDIDGEKKSRFNVEDLLERFFTLKGEAFSSDKMLLV